MTIRKHSVQTAIDPLRAEVRVGYYMCWLRNDRSWSDSHTSHWSSEVASCLT